MQIILIRHLPTNWNRNGMLQGKKDIGITVIPENYQEEMKGNKIRLEEFAPFDVVLASSLTRTNQTAKLYHYNPIMEPLLDELDFGDFEGRAKKELYDYFGERWIQCPETMKLGESVIALQDRIKLFLEKYKQHNNILVFGHGAWIRAFISYVQHGNIAAMNKRHVGFNDLIIVNMHSLGNIDIYPPITGES